MLVALPDDFRHDERTFDAAADPGGVEVREVDQRYAALFAELLAEGPIDADGRAQLAMAATTLGIVPERARRIEEALAAAGQARQQLEADDVVDEPSEHEVEPIAQSPDPGVGALQRRIQHLEERTRELARENNGLCEHIDKLESLVGQLQGALESTLEELDAAHRQIGQPPSMPAAAASRTAAREPAVPQESVMQLRQPAPALQPSSPRGEGELAAEGVVLRRRDNQM
jgi:hypothetical protein